jgi:hypothetical protein
MKMTSVKKLSLALLVVLATAFTANAQDARVKFTLTHEVRWEKTTLPAGTYMISVYDGPVPRAIVSSEDRKGPSIIAVPTVADYSSSCKSSSVTLVHDGAAWDVSSVCFNESGLALYFGASSSKTTLASLSPQVGSATGSH